MLKKSGKELFIAVLLFIFFVQVPAFIVLGLWILLQVASGTGYLGGSEVTGIAYAAHIGGFFAGMFFGEKIYSATKLMMLEIVPLNVQQNILNTLF